MKLLYFVPEPMPTFRADVAVLFGVELPRHHVESHIVGMKGSGDSVGTEKFRVSTPSGSGSRLRREWDYFVLCIRSLRAEGRTSDVIQVRDMVPIGLLALLWARLIGKPFVYWMSYLMSEGRLRNAQLDLASATTITGKIRARLVQLKGLTERWVLYRMLLRQADYVFVQSNAMMELIQELSGIGADKVAAVPMGVDVNQLRPDKVIPTRLQGWESAPIVAYLGTLDPIRRHDHVIDALAVVRRTHPHARLLLIGDAPKREAVDALLKYARAKGVGASLHITGWLPTNKAWALLAGADVALSYLPRDAIFDASSPTKLLEYLALGLPVVANDNPDQAWVLRKSGAGVLTDSTPVALAEGICSVLDNLADARRNATAGPTFIAAERSYEIISKRVATAYAQICSMEPA